MPGSRSRLALLVALVASIMFLVPTASQGATATVKAKGAFPNFKWAPATLTVATGTKVTWVNATTTHHSVTSYGKGWSKNTVIRVKGSKTSFTFKKAGTYLYYCRFHATVSNGQCSGTMCAKVKVH